MKVTQKISRDANPAVLGLALVAGLGVILAIIALADGVIQGNSDFTGLLLVAGLLLFILGVGGWFGLVQPYRHFDDINVPAPDEHHPAPPALEAAHDHPTETAPH
ncbi:MAG TPA: hypothetical protein VHO69_03335 [Phototrophicaceae bacterium]|nr:hypothetical protein [Phototrophicaceae bacterium]